MPSIKRLGVWAVMFVKGCATLIVIGVVIRIYFDMFELGWSLGAIPMQRLLH